MVRKPLIRSRHRWEANTKWILKKQDGRCGLDSPGSEYGQVMGFCENGIKKNCGFHKMRELLDSFRNC